MNKPKKLKKRSIIVFLILYLLEAIGNPLGLTQAKACEDQSPTDGNLPKQEKSYSNYEYYNRTSEKEDDSEVQERKSQVTYLHEIIDLNRPVSVYEYIVPSNKNPFDKTSEKILIKIKVEISNRGVTITRVKIHKLEVAKKSLTTEQIKLNKEKPLRERTQTLAGLDKLESDLNKNNSKDKIKIFYPDFIAPRRLKKEREQEYIKRIHESLITKVKDEDKYLLRTGFSLEELTEKRMDEILGPKLGDLE